ncbi:BRCA1-associated RING domain protein 1 [Homalodisca vitripennis]|nr:BRCA1-associated RING domain protein 1 [Homalodisca vitripennis]
MLWCTHSFCKDCILRMRSCPECSFTVMAQEIVPDVMMIKMLDLMKITNEITKCKNVEKSEDIKKTKEKSRNSTASLEENCIQNGSKPIKPSTKASTESIEEGVSIKSNRTEIKTPKRNVRKLPDSHCTPTQDSKERKRCVVSSKKMKTDACKTGTLTPKAPSKTSNVKSHVLFSAKKSQNTNKVNVKGETPLQIACRQGKLDLVQRLLREGAEPNVKDYADWTPLCDAVGQGHLEIVRALLEAGAAVNTPANQNTTALVEAVVRKNKIMVQLLLRHGADMHQRTVLNNTALSIADDEMRALMLAEDKVAICPHPRIITVPRAVLTIKLQEDHTNQVMSLCKKFNLTLYTTFTDDVTHIIVEKTSQNTCQGSMDVMMGILRGCSVVGVDWVSACLDTDSLLPVDNYQPCGTDDLPDTNVFHKARLNRESLLPRLFDGCHISLLQEMTWPALRRRDTVDLIQAAGARYQARPCDAERIPSNEQTVMFHTDPKSPLGMVSHIILYQPGPNEPKLKYNMKHVKSFSFFWFLQCIKTFSVEL